MESICGINCGICPYHQNNTCKGYKATTGCPFGRQCFIAKYITIGGRKK